MDIIECHFEFSGFDDSLVKAGTSVYLWNLVRQFRDAGHRVSALTPSHGLLKEFHDVTPLDWTLEENVQIRLDPDVWPGFPSHLTLPVSARAYRMQIDDIDIVLLDGELLDQFPDTFYPPAELRSRDLAALKPLIFQIAAARYLTATARPGTVIHLHEPLYHYILPAALAGHGLTVVSTVQTNFPVNTKVYGPEVRSVLNHLGADPTVTDNLADPPLDSPLHQAMRAYLPATRLYEDYPSDYISMLGLVVRSVAAMDFLSEGQLEHALTQADTPFEQLFRELAVHRELRQHVDRLVVGGCAIGDEWLHIQRTPERRHHTLTGLGLDPLLPTVYHNGRYSVQHKGLRELFHGIRRVLDDGIPCNVLLHLLSPTPPHDPDLDALANDYPTLVRVRTAAMEPAELIAWAASSDLSVFPSKFEMDTFHMAMGEAMAAGTIPIATAQRGMRHFEHSPNINDPWATGLALPRSFQNDDPQLTDAVYTGLRRMIDLAQSDPDRLKPLRVAATEIGRRFTWNAAAQRFLTIFQKCLDDRPSTNINSSTLKRLSASSLLEAGTGHCSQMGDRIEITWTAPNAAAVQIIIPRKTNSTYQLAHNGADAFTGTIPTTDADTLAVLVTSTSGGGTWTELAVNQ